LTQITTGIPHASSSSQVRYSSAPAATVQDGSVEAALAQLGLLNSFPDLAPVGSSTSTSTSSAPRFGSSVPHNTASFVQPHNNFGAAQPVVRGSSTVNQAVNQGAGRKAVGGINIRL
jgi:hypothetical protein